MGTDIDDFYEEFQQQIYAAADAEGKYAEDAFFDIFCSHLIAAGELETADRAHYLPPRGMRIDGYGGDPQTTGHILSLIVADYNQSEAIETLTASDMEAIFRRAQNFLVKSLDRAFRDSLEESSPAFGLADLISVRWPDVEKVRLFMISNRQLSTRVDGREAGDVTGVPVTYSVWDIGRLHRFVASGHGREEIVIDLVNDFGGPLPLLPAHLKGVDYQAYLAVLPGWQIAQIYDRWGARLLEQNVRVFLQARGNVNKGIRNTIENDPEMFLAYNNGLTATAEKVDTRSEGGVLLLTGMTNFQIVNGGQTTASVHAASKKKEVDLSRVFVQMKLSVIDPARAEEVVPRISEYANTQNRVNAADFFSNHPFHIRMEEFSRRLFAPSPDGTFRQSKWFYERARGQYQDAKSKLTPAQKRRFDLEYPPRQVFDKTDLAKYHMSWAGLPHIVSRGAQKNFARFAEMVGKEWAKQPDAFGELYYRHTVAKAIIFRSVEKLVSEQAWYEGGYRANIVTYAIARFAVDVESAGQSFDFESVWKQQGLTEELREALTVAASAVHDIIIAPPPAMRNVTEWAKQEACWTRVRALQVPWPEGLLDGLRSLGDQRDIRTEGIKEQRVLNGIEAQVAVMEAGAELWRLVRSWGQARKLLTEKELGILAVAAAIPDRVPSDKQSVALITTLKRLHREGCQLGLNICE